MIKKNGILTLTTIYTLIMLLILACAIILLTNTLRKQAISLPTAETKNIYVYITETPEHSHSEESVSQPIGWIVKEHRGRIGIFDQEGTLISILDTYVKTLPDADRSLLGEGIKIETEAQLYALIEDYTS